jgi:hypothetical protein
LLLIIAAYLPLAYANRWALQASAVLGGIGIGLFIDEVGKFITQANDYFFPPALPLIYGFVLLNVLVYLYFQRPHKGNPRCALYHALEGLQDLLDGDFGASKAEQVEAQLAIASRSERPEIASLANTLKEYLEKETESFSETSPSFWGRITLWVESAGSSFGRRIHRALVSVTLIGWIILVVGYITVTLRGGTNLDPQVLQWRTPLIVVKALVGVFLVISLILWLIKKEELGLKFGVSGFLISLVALQLLYFYLSQFAAITATLLQLVILLVLLAYRRWHLNGSFHKQ